MDKDWKTRRVVVTPDAGFVIKTSTTQQGFYTPSPSPPRSSPSPLSLPLPTRAPVPPLLKIFVNVAYSESIPAPPTTSIMKLSAEEENQIIERAMAGDENSPYFVPVVVSEGREDKDKAGKPSLVFDAILHPSIKSRMAKDLNFRSFVLEIILSHIESPPQAPNTLPTRSLSLSRTLGTPNIRSKGPLASREVEVPDFGQVQEGSSSSGSGSAVARSTEPLPTSKPKPNTENVPKKPMIEEISSSPAAVTHKPKSILKKPAAPALLEPVQRVDDIEPDLHVKTEEDANLETPAWHWDGDSRQRRDKLIIDIPKFTRPDHARSTLTLSPNILALRTPAYFLQLSLDEDVDVERARAEWRVGEGKLFVYV